MPIFISMPDIHHYFQIHSSPSKVFACISTAAGLDKWWTKLASGTPAAGEKFALHFGPGYNWSAVVSKCTPDSAMEFTMTDADKNWTGSKVGFRLTFQNNTTDVQFYHTGWKEDNEHFRISNYCWAMYLRILKRYVEFGEFVAYEDRLNV